MVYKPFILFHDESKLHFNKMTMMMSTLC